MPDEPATIPEAPALPLDKPRCRALTVNGKRCKNEPLHGLHLCFTHYNHRYPALPDPKHVAIPLLEDDSSISLLLTQVTHSLLSNQLDPIRARTTIYALQVAAYVVAQRDRREAREARAVKTAHPDSQPGSPADPVPGQQVSRLGYDHEGFISADGDLPEPNPLCPEPPPGPTPWDLADQVHPHNQLAPDRRNDEPPSPDGEPDDRKPEDPWGDEQRARRKELRRAPSSGTERAGKDKYDLPGPGERYHCPSSTLGCLGPRYDRCCSSCLRRRKKLDPSECDPTPANLLDDDLQAVADPAPSTPLPTPDPYPLNPASPGNTQNALPSTAFRINHQPPAPPPGGTLRLRDIRSLITDHSSLITVPNPSRRSLILCLVPNRPGVTPCPSDQ